MIILGRNKGAEYEEAKKALNPIDLSMGLYFLIEGCEDYPNMSIKARVLWGIRTIEMYVRGICRFAFTYKRGLINTIKSVRNPRNVYPVSNSFWAPYWEYCRFKTIDGWGTV